MIIWQRTARTRIAKPSITQTFFDENMVGLARYARVLTTDKISAGRILAACLIEVEKDWPTICRSHNPLAEIRRRMTALVRSDDLRSPIPSVETAGDFGRLQNVLAVLSTTQRTVVVMRFHLDMSELEIAAELKCSEESVRTALDQVMAILEPAPKVVAAV